MSTQKRRAQSDGELISEFRQACDRVAALGVEIGKEILPYNDPSLPLYSSLDFEKKLTTLESLGSYLEVCEETISGGYDLASLQLIWFALNKLKLKPPSNLFDLLKREDVVEVHDFEGIQTFRNFNFYDFCSYTLEELYCHPWTNLFHHHEPSMAKVIDFTIRVAKGEIKAAEPMKMEPHLACELYSTKLNGVRIHFKYGAPLFDEFNSPVATLTVESLELLTRAEKEALMPHAKKTKLQIVN